MTTAIVWTSTVVLVIVGVTAGVYRALYINDATLRAEPLREQVLSAFNQTDPIRAARPDALRQFDSRFATHPVLTLGHVVPGSLFLALAPLQFCARLRNRYRWLHRWSGRVLVFALIASTLPAIYFGLLIPFAGASESLLIAAVAALLLAALARAVVAIRRGDVAQHRKWMLRAFALALGIATIRVVGAVLDLILAPLGIPLATGFAATLWLGWGVMIVAVEWWIRSMPYSAAANGGARI